jgi:2-hydroxycyclohexanecarboxyl-CoA dehydrogenase
MKGAGEAGGGNGLDGRVALVTGAGQGIGAAIARRLAAERAVVAVNALHPEKAQRTTDQIVAGGGRALAVPGDVASAEVVDALVGRVESAAGPVEILVNNAAILKMSGFLELDPADFDRTIDVNLTGVMHCTRRVLPGMLAARWGRIVTIASQWGRIGAKGASPYSAAKGGLIAMTTALAREVEQDGVIVTAIGPGTVDTPQLNEDAAFMGLSLDEVRDRYSQETLIGRIASPEEIAGLAMWLASDNAVALSGHTVPATGGRSE